MSSVQKETLDEGSTSDKFPVTRHDQAAHEEALGSFSRRLDHLGLPGYSTGRDDGTLSGDAFEERLPLVWLLHEVLHCCQVSAQVAYLKENRVVAKQLWSACEQLGNHCSGSLPSEKRRAFSTFLAMLLLRLTSRSRTHRPPNPSQASPSKAEERKEASRTAIRLLLLKRQQLLMQVLLWNIDHPRVQQAWFTIAGNACICGHGDAICANANIDHMLAFGKLAMAALSERLHARGLQGEWQDRDAASACLAEGCIMAAEAINTAVSAIYNSEAHSADPDAEFEPSQRVQELLGRAASLARYADLEHMVTRLAEPLMVQLVQSILQLQAQPILLLDLDSTPAILDVLFKSPNARYSFQSMLRTKLAQLCSQQECFLRRDSQPRLHATSQAVADHDTSRTLRKKVLQSMKLLLIVIKLSEALDTDTIWASLQNMLLEDHSDHAQYQLRAGKLTSKTVGTCSGSSLLQAIACCYKGYLSIASKQTQDRRRADEGAQHLARLSRSRTFPTKSYQQHQAETQQDRQQLQTFGGSDLVASLLARILARLVNPSCLPEAVGLLMLDSGLPEAVLAATDEAGCFDHCEILMKAMIQCGCQSWLPVDHESSLPMHLGTMSALIRSRDEEVEAIKSKCKQQAEDARLAKWVQRQKQSKAQIQAAEEAQALRAAEEAQKRKDAADARQAREMRRVKEHQDALKRKTEQLAKQEAAKKAKASEAAGSHASKTTPQAPPEQMGSLGWISSWVPGSRSQMGQGRHSPDDGSKQTSWDDDSRDDDWEGHQDRDSSQQGLTSMGYEHNTEAMAAASRSPGSADRHWHEKASGQDLSKAAGQAIAGETCRDEAANLSNLQHRQADKVAQRSRGGIGDSLQSHPLPDDHPLPDEPAQGSPGAIPPWGSKQRPAAPIPADQVLTPAPFRLASGNAVAVSSGKQVESVLNPKAGVGEQHHLNAVRSPGSDQAGFLLEKMQAGEEADKGLSSLSSHTAAAHQKGQQSDAAAPAAAANTASHLNSTVASRPPSTQDEQEGPMLHDPMLWSIVEPSQDIQSAAHSGVARAAVHTGQPNADTASTVLSSDQSSDFAGLQSARQAPFGRHNSSHTNEVFGLQAAREQEALSSSHHDLAAELQVNPGLQPIPEGNPFGNVDPGLLQPGSSRKEEAALQHAADTSTCNSQRTGRTPGGTCDNSPAGAQDGAQTLPADPDYSGSHPRDSGIVDAGSSQPVQRPGSSKQGQADAAGVAGAGSSWHAQRPGGITQDEADDASVAGAGPGQTVQLPGLIRHGQADTASKHAEQGCRSAGHGRQGGKGNLASQPSLQIHDTAELLRDSAEGGFDPQAWTQEHDQDADHQASVRDLMMASLTSMMGAASLSNSPCRSRPMQPPDDPAAASDPQKTQSEPWHLLGDKENDTPGPGPDGDLAPSSDQRDPHGGRGCHQHESFSSPAEHSLQPGSDVLQAQPRTAADSSNACHGHSVSPKDSSHADDRDAVMAHETLHGQLQHSSSSSDFSDDDLPGSPSQGHVLQYDQLSSGSSLSSCKEHHVSSSSSSSQPIKPSADVPSLMLSSSSQCQRGCSLDKALDEVSRWQQSDPQGAAEQHVYLLGYEQPDYTRAAPDQHSSVELQGTP